MKKNKLFYTLLPLLFASIFAHADKRKILFIGNSYTAVNNLPNTLKSVALSMGDTLEIDSNTPGGMTFNMHTTDATTLSKIALGGWDYVVLQAQSQEPSFDPTQVALETYPYAAILDSLIHAADSCTETIFYMTWGRKNGDASNCAAYPPICTYAGMQQRLRESYLEMTMNNQATCSPVGVAWKRVRDSYPSIELYNADESHPSINGTYLIACTFYSTLYHKSCIGASFVSAGVSSSDALNLQTMATHTVLDSIENWQQYGNIPRAACSFSNNQNIYSFNNVSLRATQYEWNFGDGTAINTQTNPSHTFTSIGNYVLSLKAKNNCGHYDILNDTIKITSIPSEVNNIEDLKKLNVYCSSNRLQLNNSVLADEIKLYNMNGAMMGEYTLQVGINSINLSALQRGLYGYSLFSKHKVISTGKINVQ